MKVQLCVPSQFYQLMWLKSVTEHWLWACSWAHEHRAVCQWAPRLWVGDFLTSTYAISLKLRSRCPWSTSIVRTSFQLHALLRRGRGVSACKSRSTRTSFGGLKLRTLRLWKNPFAGIHESGGDLVWRRSSEVREKNISEDVSEIFREWGPMRSKLISISFWRATGNVSEIDGLATAGVVCIFTQARIACVCCVFVLSLCIYLLHCTHRDITLADYIHQTPVSF